MALGTQRRTVVWMVLRDVLLLAVLGLAISLPMAFGASKLLQSLLFGVKPGDPWSLKGVWWRIFEAMSDDPDFEYLIVNSTIVPSPPARCRGQKRGSEGQAIGRSRGGLSTKMVLVVRGLGCPVRFMLTAGQKGDAPQAAALLEGLPAEVVMADTAYDADHLRQAIAAKGALAVIPNNPSRALKYRLDKHLYAQRHLVECCFSKLKQFRRVATRFEKTARNYLAVVTLAAIILWMR